MYENALRIDSRFANHPPTDEQISKYETVRDAGRRMARTLAELCPPSPDLTLAINAVDDAVMRANAAIARN